MGTGISPKVVEEHLKDVLAEASKALALLEDTSGNEIMLRKVKTHAHNAARAAWRLDQIIDSLEA